MKLKVYTPLQMQFAALHLVNQINRLGYECTYEEKLDCKDKKSLWIIYNTSMQWCLPQNYISYQTEQAGTAWFNDRYYERLQKSVAIWEYNEGNLYEYEHLNKNISMVSCGINPQEPTKKDIPLLFYGSINERRREALKGLNAHTITNKLGKEMQDILKRAKTVLNVHYYEHAPLEQFRINEALSYGCNVVSEFSLHGMERYTDLVSFGEIKDLKELSRSPIDINKKDLSALCNLDEIRVALARL